MSVYRYLIRFSYLGTPFRGAQRQVPGTFPRIDDPLTIQGRLEMALKRLKPVNEPCIALSSRTDSGVHAFNTTCHVDLARANGQPYDPCVITGVLNKVFINDQVPIRILKTYIVPDTFHARGCAISRTYLYRILVARVKDDKSDIFTQYMPIEEWKRCFFVRADLFDLDAVRQCAKMFEGFHDFRSFMGTHLNSSEKITRKHVEYIRIEEASRGGFSPFSWPHFIGDADYLFLNIYMKSTGFLFKQVRRTVGALSAVAQGKVNVRDIKFMLEVPSRHSWCPKLRTAPAHGLYLCDVEYTKEDEATFRTEAEDLS